MERSEHPPLAPATEPIDRLIAPLQRFLHVEAAGGIVLLACTVVALVIANSSLGDAYQQWWHTQMGVDFGIVQLRKSLEHWINDGLMTLFFFVVGLEVKRELVLGELRDPRAAVLPIAGAIGGMAGPACLYLLLIGNAPGARGWGIPMATDIAFVVGCMAVLGRRVPHGLRVIVLSLAIADDIGAILVIALGYSSGIAWLPLALGLLGLGVVVLCERLGIRSFGIYTLIGVAIWVAFVKSGVHATIAGVILGLLTPARPYLSQGRLRHVGRARCRSATRPRLVGGRRGGACPRARARQPCGGVAARVPRGAAASMGELCDHADLRARQRCGAGPHRGSDRPCRPGDRHQSPRREASRHRGIELAGRGGGCRAVARRRVVGGHRRRRRALRHRLHHGVVHCQFGTRRPRTRCGQSGDSGGSALAAMAGMLVLFGTARSADASGPDR